MEFEEFISAAVAALKADDPDAARGLLERALRLRPDDADALFWLGASLHRMGELAAAEDALERAQVGRPDDAGIREGLVNVLLSRAQNQIEQGRFDAVEAPLAKVRALDPHNTAAALLAADALFHGGERERAIPILEEAHAREPDDVQVTRNLAQFLGLTRRYRDAMPFARRMQALEPQNPNWYSLLCYGAHAARLPAEVEKWLALGQAALGRSIDYQSAAEVAVEDDEVVCLADHDERRRVRVTAGEAAEHDSGTPDVDAPVPGRARALVGEATLIGNTGVTLNGYILGVTFPGRLRFRYGYDRERLRHETPEIRIPPAGRRRLHVPAVRALPLSQCYAVDWRFPRDVPRSSPDPDAPGDPIAIRLMTPFGKDRNHLSGIGVADLMFGWSCLPEFRHRDAAGLPGEAVDLRDAELEVVLSAAGLDTRDFRFGLAITADLLPDPESSEPRYAAWVLSSGLIRSEVLSVGTWQHLRFRLANDTTRWMLAGNNETEQGASARRYRYAPLDWTLSKFNGNFVLWFLFGDELDTPHGHLDLHSFTLTYRDASLLQPGGPARLIRSPADAPVAATRLIDGWTGFDGHLWISTENPSGPQEFEWVFDGGAVIHSLRLHQNSLFPAKEVRVEASDGGGVYHSILSVALPGEPSWAPQTRGSTYFPLDAPVSLTHLRLRILSGHRRDRWGLDLIEAYGEAAGALPSATEATASADVGGLEPGRTLHFRLVGEAEGVRVQSELASVHVPAGRRPVLHAAEVAEIGPETVGLRVRLTAFGLPTTVGVRLSADGSATVSRDFAGGSEESTGHAFAVVHGLRPGLDYIARLTAQNEAGESEPLVLRVTLRPRMKGTPSAR